MKYETPEQYTKLVKAVIKQYEDGAITAHEMINKIFVETNDASLETWYPQPEME